MKEILFFAAITLISSQAFAYREHYVCERPDGSVAIHHYDSDDGVTPEQKMAEHGLGGLPCEKVEASNIPDSKADRDYWKLSGKRVVIDTVKKNADRIRKDAALSKLGITKQELREAWTS